jgi:signal transduction histidine kinase/ActR/RegA family two-component response regulator
MDPGSDLYFDETPASRQPLAWVAIGIDLEQRRQLVAQLLLASVGITLLGVLLAVLLVRQLALTGVRPLMDILASVKRISSGAFGVQMQVTANSPELRELQAMVNQMSESLRAYRHEMEAKVGIATAELEHKTREAEQASQAKSRFLAAASHDLRQPMHAISLYVESLKPQMKGRAGEETLQKLERSVFSMIEMFNAILDVSRLDAGVIQPRLAPVRISRLLLDIAEEFAGEADAKNLSLRVRAADRWVDSDPMLLGRIVRNLLSNALRHTAQGGILLSARPCGGRVRLQVWDTGSGIAPEHQPHVFYEFYQVEPQGDRAQHGLGLGLSIVRRLARLLGYPLQLRSRPGRGTVFSIDLPPAAPCGGVEGGRVLPAQSLVGRAVVIDDDVDVRDALGRLLRAWGMEVQTFARLGELDAGLTSAPDVVLADYQLSGRETGLAAIDSVRSRWGAAIPAIVVTGDTRAESVQRFSELGMPVLYKPVQPAQLLSLLQASLAPRAAASAASTAQ